MRSLRIAQGDVTKYRCTGCSIQLSIVPAKEHRNQTRGDNRISTGRNFGGALIEPSYAEIGRTVCRPTHSAGDFGNSRSRKKPREVRVGDVMNNVSTKTKLLYLHR
jgi:hypothetical protein